MRILALALASVCAATPQPRTMTQGAHRMEISLERLDNGKWNGVDPGLVLAQGDRVRFRFSTNFDGYLYVMNQSTSGAYEQLFPREETGQDNRVAGGRDYSVPSTASVFRIAGPAGYEVVYWLITPARLTDAPPRFGPPPTEHKVAPPTLIPRCDNTLLRSRGDCIDNSAGPKLVPRGADVPGNLAQAAGQNPNNLVVMRQKDTAVISSPEPLTGPVIYEFRLAHK
jgi:hypothetical protein